MEERKEALRLAREHKMQLKQIAKVGYVLPSEENKETEKALRRIATKGGWSREWT